MTDDTNSSPRPNVRKAAPEGTQAVVRAIRLLKSFTREQPQASLAELCERVGLTKTTVGGPSRRLDPSRLAELGVELRTIAVRLSAQIDPGMSR